MDSFIGFSHDVHIVNVYLTITMGIFFSRSSSFSIEGIAFLFLLLLLLLLLKKEILRAFWWGVRHIPGKSCSRKTPPVNVNAVLGLLLDLLGLT